MFECSYLHLRKEHELTESKLFNPATPKTTENSITAPIPVNGGTSEPGNALPPSEMPIDEFKKRVVRAKRREEHLRKKIDKARKKGKQNWLRLPIHRYLNSHDVKLAVLVDRWNKKRRRKVLNSKLLLTLVQQIDPFNKCGEQVTVNIRPKNSDSEDWGRPILSFRLVESTHQEMLRRVMANGMRKTTNQQYSSRRGRPKAIKEVKKHLADGFVHVIEADIKSCYASYDKSKLPELFQPIPGKVIQEILVPELMGRLVLHKESPLIVSQPMLNAPLDVLWENADPVFVQARLGLMQGSVASPLASDILLTQVMQGMADAPGKVVNYADNFALMAKTQNDVMSMFQTLRSLLKDHPAGPLSLKNEWETSKTNGYFEFLGYDIMIGKFSIYFEPTMDNYQKFHEEVNRQYKRILTKTLSKMRRLKRIKRLREYVRSWTDAFIESPEAQKIRERWNDKLDKVLSSKLLFKSDDS